MITGDSWRVNMANKLVAMGCIFLSGEDGYNVMHVIIWDKNIYNGLYWDKMGWDSVLSGENDDSGLALRGYTSTNPWPGIPLFVPVWSHGQALAWFWCFWVLGKIDELWYVDFLKKMAQYLQYHVFLIVHLVAQAAGIMCGARSFNKNWKYEIRSVHMDVLPGKVASRHDGRVNSFSVVREAESCCYVKQ